MSGNDSILRPLLAPADLKPGQRLLLLAPGPDAESIQNALWPLLAEQAVTFLDSEPSKLRRAAAQDPAPRVVRARAVRLPFRRHAFEALLSFEALFAIRPPWTLLAEYHRVLVPDGRLLLFEPAAEGFVSMLRARFFGPGRRIFAPGEIQERLRRAGFAVEWSGTLPASETCPRPAQAFRARKKEYPAQAAPSFTTGRELRARQQENKARKLLSGKRSVEAAEGGADPT